MGVTAAQLRQEIFALGGRHMGDALNGAIIELEDEALTYERRRLLAAVVAHLSADGRAGDAIADKPILPTVSLLNAVYLTVFAASVIWSLVNLQNLLG